MGNFAENLNLGNRVRPPLLSIIKHILTSSEKPTIIFFFMKFAQFEEFLLNVLYLSALKTKVWLPPEKLVLFHKFTVILTCNMNVVETRLGWPFTIHI